MEKVMIVNLGNQAIQENIPQFIDGELPSLSETEQGVG
ncbi:hypothetical protein APA_4181 [Pseudanabaena sp. lw0831]|nr:hypothetical protein APA_4181 [Pseudanabaena sp. lw0831]